MGYHVEQTGKTKESSSSNSTSIMSIPQGDTLDTTAVVCEVIMALVYHAGTILSSLKITPLDP